MSDNINEQINYLEEILHQQDDGEISQTQINEIGRQLFNVFDRITGKRRNWTAQQLHEQTHIKVLPE